jgi:hypothetical protein
MTRPIHHKNHLAAIHIAHKALGLSKDDALALKMSVTGVASARDMTEQQRRRYLAHLSGLQSTMAAARGEKPAYVPKRPALEQSIDDSQDVRWHKARMLWRVLADAGHVRINTDAALMAYVQRQTNMAHWRFLNTHQINGVIESLKRWCDRKNVALRPFTVPGSTEVHHG